jgi:hypothetical protein
MSSPVISCNIVGGLGNQLFQIMTTIGYAIRNKCVFIFPYETQVMHRFTYWDSFLSNLKQFTTNNIHCKFKNIDLQHYLPKYSEPVFHYSPIPYFEKSYFLDGYFQSYKYFDSEKKYIFKMIHLEENRKSVKSEFSHYFENNSDIPPEDKTEILISMHFRLGDYKSLPNFHPVLPIHYYQKSLEYLILKLDMENKCKKLKILYCCEKNDNEIVLNNIQYLISCVNTASFSLEFVKVSDDICDWKQMLIMSLCDHHIIANSTFSWWSAYFNEYDKMVCYPSIWFGVSLKNKLVNDMYPVSWTKIEC